MKGERLPDGFDDGLPPPSTYWRGARGSWSCCTPNGLLGNLSRHDVIEHEDETITVLPSILVTTHDGQRWHGYIERGVWREC